MARWVPSGSWLLRPPATMRRPVGSSCRVRTELTAKACEALWYSFQAARCFPYGRVVLQSPGIASRPSLCAHRPPPACTRFAFPRTSPMTCRGRSPPCPDMPTCSAVAAANGVLAVLGSSSLSTCPSGAASHRNVVRLSGGVVVGG